MNVEKCETLRNGIQQNTSISNLRKRVSESCVLRASHQIFFGVAVFVYLTYFTDQIMKGLLLLLLLWKPYLVQVNANLYHAEYNEDFYSFAVRINEMQQKGLVQELFNNLLRENATNKCIKDLNNYRNSIESQEQWAIALLDSSGITFTGLLSGNTINLGNYKQCISTFPKNFGSSYCTVEFKISNKPSSTLPSAPDKVPVVLSLCLPDTCSSKEIRTLLEPSTPETNATLQVECQSRREGFTFGDFSAMFLYVLVWIIIISTSLPEKWIPIKNNVCHQIWDSFSFQRNIANLFKTNTSYTPLSSLNGLRVLSQCAIVWYHIAAMEAVGKQPILNYFSYNEFFRSWKGAIVTELPLAVDTFFVISGLLITVNWLGKKRKFNLASYYIHRYLRITPPYMATLLMTSTFVNKLYDGPLYTSLIDVVKQRCVSYWWTNVLYINNLYPASVYSCMGHSWYLAADWQLFFFISPFVVIVINKWPHHLNKLIIAIILTSITSTFLVSYLYHLPTETMYNKSEESPDYYDKLYLTPYMRAGPWAIGMLYGALLHNFKNNKMKLSRKMNLIAWLLTLLGLSLSFELVLLFVRKIIDQNGVWSALYNTIQPNLFAASIGWIIFSSETHTAGIIGRILSLPVFQPFAKLSYSAYLIHYLIIQHYVADSYGYHNISPATQIPVILGIISLSYAAALLLYLSFEAPIINLDYILFQKEARGDQCKKEIVENNSAPKTLQP